jgi:hypothetical protein
VVLTLPPEHLYQVHHRCRCGTSIDFAIRLQFGASVNGKPVFDMGGLLTSSHNQCRRHISVDSLFAGDYRLR